MKVCFDVQPAPPGTAPSGVLPTDGPNHVGPFDPPRRRRRPRHASPVQGGPFASPTGGHPTKSPPQWDRLEAPKHGAENVPPHQLFWTKGTSYYACHQNTISSSTYSEKLFKIQISNFKFKYSFE